MVGFRRISGTLLQQLPSHFPEVKATRVGDSKREGFSGRNHGGLFKLADEPPLMLG